MGTDAPGGGPAWTIIVEFLRGSDHQLFERLSRRMLNHLCWSGVEEAQHLLQRFASAPRDTDARDDNRPAEKSAPLSVIAAAEAAFDIAARHLSDEEILLCLQRWVRDDKSGFLIEAVENLGTSLSDIVEALERYEQFNVSDRALSRTRQLVLKAALVRRFFSDDLDVINTARPYVEVSDFCRLVRRVVAPPGSHGKLGGKSAGMFLAGLMLERSHDPALRQIRTPNTWYVTSDALLHFVEFNHLEDVYDRKYQELDQVRREYPHIVQVFKNSGFPPDLTTGLSLALDDLAGRPVVVRSSSLLEDGKGAAFSGKYKSLFLANQGTKSQRLAALQDAISEVWASIFGPDPIEYRAERGLLDMHEEMGVMIQEVVGTRCGDYYFPSVAGVALGENDFQWSPRLDRASGLIRMVFGLGTRAVDRVSDDFPVLCAPGQPGIRVNVVPEEIARYAQRRVDVINMATGRFDTIPVRLALEQACASMPGLRQLLSVWNGERFERAPRFGPLDLSHAVVTFDELLEGTFAPTMHALLTFLGEQVGHAVEIEFASDGTQLFLLQCRGQSNSQDCAPATLPSPIEPRRLLFFADRYITNTRVPPLTHIVFVDPGAYRALPDLDAMQRVAGVIGRLNALLPRRQFALLGPGRWGSRGDIRMGVGVSYADINNTALLIEVASTSGDYEPEPSFGTHFFQALVEARISYLPLFPESGRGYLNRDLLGSAPNQLASLVPEAATLQNVIRVVDARAVANGCILRVLTNADTGEAAGLFEPVAPGGPAARTGVRPVT
ncbi:MAG: PEP/pyruvate-binding domain-containing protein [Vicinamibacterales bacterium]